MKTHHHLKCLLHLSAVNSQVVYCGFPKYRGNIFESVTCIKPKFVHLQCHLQHHMSLICIQTSLIFPYVSQKTNGLYLNKKSI